MGLAHSWWEHDFGHLEANVLGQLGGGVGGGGGGVGGGLWTRRHGSIFALVSQHRSWDAYSRVAATLLVGASGAQPACVMSGLGPKRGLAKKAGKSQAGCGCCCLRVLMRLETRSVERLQ